MAKRRNRSDAPWTIISDRGIATINTTIGRKRCRKSLGIAYDPATASARDVRAIEAEAARVYQELVAGRVLEVGPHARILTSHTLHELFALWLVDAEKLWPRSVKTRIWQLGAVEAWADGAPRFKNDKRPPIERLMDESGPSQFATDRLAQVLRGTVSGELSNLYAFFVWAKREHHIASIPERPKLPRGALGKRKGPQRSKPVDITRKEALALCAALPEWTARGGAHEGRGEHSKNAIRVRDPFRLQWELALRPGIVEKISVPEHWMPGQGYLSITDDIDKIGLARRLQLTKAAREILERCAPERGLIFGAHALTHQIKKAAEAVLPLEKAKQFARYDFRHGRAVDSLETTGDLIGTQRLLGQLQATTTNRYLRTREAHSARVIAALDADADAAPIGGIASGSPPTSTADQESNAMATRKYRDKVENAREDHSSRAPISPHLPRGELGEPDATAADLSEPARSKTAGDGAEGTDNGPRSSGIGLEGPPVVITNAQRSLAITEAVWGAFDLFALHAAGIELEDVDGDTGGSR